MVREVKWTKYLWLSLLSFGAFILEYLSIFVIEVLFLLILIKMKAILWIMRKLKWKCVRQRIGTPCFCSIRYGAFYSIETVSSYIRISLIGFLIKFVLLIKMKFICQTSFSISFPFFHKQQVSVV